MQTLDFLPVVQKIVNETRPNDRIFVWGSSPKLYSFSDRRMATRFVSCSHLVGAYASRPHEVRDKGQSVIPESWKMFQTDWEAHPPVLIIDMSTVGPVLVGSSNDAISRASRLPSWISRGECDQWRNNLSSALTPQPKQRA